jgi:hypothetical protein
MNFDINNFSETFKELLAAKRAKAGNQAIRDAKLNEVDPVGLKRANNRVISYSARHRSQFFKPEYDFEEIQIAEGIDSITFRAINKKTNRIISAGWNFVGPNDEAVSYIKRRIAEIERVSNSPFKILISQTARDMFRFSNAIWVKARSADSSSGKVRKDYRGIDVQPVAGYFPLAMETVKLKTKENGDLLAVEQNIGADKKKEFLATDVVHFYSNRNPGWSVGTPELYPALDDIALLRHIESNVSELIESSLFPFMHYKIGTDEHPERVTEKGLKESEVVKRKLEYMPSNSIWVSDHRHQIEAIGAEGRSLRVEPYLAYFKTRVMTAVGISPVDLGEGGDANRSTASTMSKSTVVDVEAMQCILKIFIEFFVIDELLMEGGYDPTDPEHKVEILFGVIDRTERMAMENQVIQKWNNNLITVDEARGELGLQTYTDEQLERTFMHMFSQPDTLAKGMGPGTAAAETLATSPTSPVTPEAVAKEKQFAKQITKMGKPAAGAKSSGRPTSKKSGASASKSRPSNQHGTRSGPKSSSDQECILLCFDAGNDESLYYLPEEYSNVSAGSLQKWIEVVNNRHKMLQHLNISYSTVADSLLHRIGE